jgi:hypothetical protein
MPDTTPRGKASLLRSGISEIFFMYHWKANSSFSMEAPPMKKFIRSTIAERRLTLRNGSPNPKEVRVIVGKPTESDDKQDYYCQVQILGLGDEKIRSIYGLDSMQALQLAVRFISAQLDKHRKYLRWLNNEDIGL